MPGFIDVKSFKADDGERLTVVWWENEETLKAWREQARHRVAQRTGRERWTGPTSSRWAEWCRTNAFERPAASPT